MRFVRFNDFGFSKDPNRVLKQNLFINVEDIASVHGVRTTAAKDGSPRENVYVHLKNKRVIALHDNGITAEMFVLWVLRNNAGEHVFEGALCPKDAK